MAFRFLALLFAVFSSIECQVWNLSCQQIKDFVNGHNIRREQLLHGKVEGQPAASQMNYMVWDNEVAAKAADWASVYRNSHNPDTSIPSGRFNVGENLFWLWTTNKDHQLSVDDALKSWFDEHYDYTYGEISSSDFSGPKQVGHYTQMAWSNSVYLGCAISQFLEDGSNKFFVVCNYGPPGNYMGQRPYNSGNPGQQLTCSIGNCDRPYGDRC